MRCGRSYVLCIMILLALAGPASLLLAQTADSSGCKDHPLLTRMQNMHIVMCKTVDFDRFVYKTGKGTETAVEGRRFDIKYQINPGNVAPAPLAIIRNHQQAIAKIGSVFNSQRMMRRYATEAYIHH